MPRYSASAMSACPILTSAVHGNASMNGCRLRKLRSCPAFISIPTSRTFSAAARYISIAAAHSADYSVSHWEKIRCSTRERQEFAHHAAVLDYCFHNLRGAVGFCRADALSEYRRRWIFLFGGTQRSLRRKTVAAVGKPGNYGNAVFCQLTAHMSGHFFSVIRTPSCADYCKRRFGLQSCAFASCIKHKRRIRNIFQFGRISFTVRSQC